MNCHECAVERTAVSTCRFCPVTLCKDRLVASVHLTTATLYARDHHPERPYATTPDGVHGDAVAGQTGSI